MNKALTFLATLIVACVASAAPALADPISMLAAAGTAMASAGTAVGAAVSGMTLFQGLGLLGSAVSAVGAISSASAQSDAYKLQATNAIIQGNAQSMEYQRQGIQVMRKVAETEATVRARGAAGGIDPFSGSAGQIADLAMTRGLDEYEWARENAQNAIFSGKANSAAMMSAASSAETAGYFNAGSSLLMGFGQLAKTGFAPTKSLATPIKPS